MSHAMSHTMSHTLSHTMSHTMSHSHIWCLIRCHISAIINAITWINISLQNLKLFISEHTRYLIIINSGAINYHPILFLPWAINDNHRMIIEKTYTLKADSSNAISVTIYRSVFWFHITCRVSCLKIKTFYLFYPILREWQFDKSTEFLISIDIWH